MYNLKELEELTVKWSDDRGILKNGKATTQALKLVSELGEFSLHIEEKKDLKDDIGDAMVVLTNISRLIGITSLDECVADNELASTWLLFSELGKLSDNIIKNRVDEAAINIGNIIYNLKHAAISYESTLEECWAIAYDDIKDRVGFLNEHGNFIKSTTPGYDEMYDEFLNKNNKTLYVDVETTGLIKYVHGIIVLAYIIEDADGNELTRGEIEMNPLTYSDKVSPKALEINGYTLEQIKELPDAKEACLKFISVLNEHLDSSNFKDKYKVVAYNADFDTGFIQTWMDKLVPSTYWKLMDYKHLDPFALIKYLQHFKHINTGKSQSLEAVAKFYNIEHIPHNAMSDIEVTRKIHKILVEEYM